MRPDVAWLSLAIYQFHCQVMDLLAVDAANTEVAAEVSMAYQDVVLSAAHAIRAARCQNRSFHEEVTVVFDDILIAEGRSDEDRAKARNIRQSVMLMADKLLENAGLQNGDDPPHADPGGGLRSHDDWRKTDQE